MKKNYGNSFGHLKSEAMLGRVALFPMVDEFHPVGAYVAKGGAYEAGAVIAAGTPVSLDKIGGAPVLNGEAPVGLVYEDAIMGEDGATVTIVTRGQVNESLYKGTYTEAQKEALAGRMLFIKEV
jgi:hypothetical protein